MQRNIVITGGSRGLGLGIAKKLLPRADKMVLLDINMEALADAVKELDPTGENVFGIGCDVSDAKAVETAFTEIFEKIGHVDILVNNAGITRDAMFHKMSNEQFEIVMKVDAFSAFYCTRQVVNKMREQKWGRIISMSSMAAYGHVGQCNYSMAKAALLGMTKTLSKELANKNITVNALAPAVINTDMIKSIPEEQMKMIVESIPMKRVGEVEEVAATVAFLASEEASYVTGQCICCDGALG